MKGLLAKDLCLLKNQKQFFLIIIIFIAISSVSLDPSSIVVFCCTVVSMFTVSTLTYDEYDNGYAYLFTLPITRKSYIIEKYLYCFLLTFTAAFFCFIFMGIYQWIKTPAFNVLEWGMICAAIAIAMFVVNSIMIPLYLKFGGEKGRIALLAGMMLLVGGTIVISMLLYDLNITFTFFFTMSTNLIMLVAVCVACILILISFMTSLRIIRKKEF